MHKFIGIFIVLVLTVFIYHGCTQPPAPISAPQIPTIPHIHITNCPGCLHDAELKAIKDAEAKKRREEIAAEMTEALIEGILDSD